MANVEDKLAWLEAITQRIRQFVNEGGDLKSVEAAPLGMALYHATNDLTREFGVLTARPLNPRSDSIASEHGTPPYA